MINDIIAVHRGVDDREILEAHGTGAYDDIIVRHSDSQSLVLIPEAATAAVMSPSYGGWSAHSAPARQHITAGGLRSRLHGSTAAGSHVLGLRQARYRQWLPHQFPGGVGCTGELRRR